jgi:probable F420-dependent oxidoreductase
MSPWPGGGELPREYGHTLDPFVMFGAIAAATERLVLGTAVTLVIERDPIVLAKQVATLDVLSGGRFVLGVGAGWNREEMANHGTGFGTRWKLLRERVEAMKAIWASDKAEYHGDLVDFDPIWCWPKPVQRPHPPILLGGTVDAALRRAGRIADGWISSSGQDLTTIGRAIEVVAEGARQVGRDPSRLRYVCRGVVRVRPAGAETRRPLSGSFDEIRADLATLAEQGVTEVFLDLNFDPQVGSVEADAGASLRRAHEMLEELAP